MTIFQKARTSLSRYIEMCAYAMKNRGYLPLFGERIGYIGWLGHGNMGDEAMYQAARKVFKKDSVLPYKMIRGKEKIEHFCNKRIFQTVMLGGGTLINERTYFDLLQEAQHLGYPTVTFGSGVRNPEFWDTVSKDLKHIDEWIPLLEQCKFVGVRGPISKSILEHYGFHKAVITGDPALFWAQPEVKPKKMTKKLGINIGISPEKIWGTTQGVLDFIIEFVRTMIEKGWEITFVPMCDQDILYIHEAMHQIEQPVRIFTGYKSVKDTLECLQSCDIFIGEKLHSVVLACCTYTPSLMLEYRPKCRDFMASLDMGKYNVRTDSLNTEQMLALCDELNDHNGSIQRQLFESVSGHKNKLLEYADLIHRAR